MRRASLYSSSRRPRSTPESPPASADVSPGSSTSDLSTSTLLRATRSPAYAARAATPPPFTTPATPVPEQPVPATRPRWYKRAGRFAAPALGAAAGALLVLGLQGGLGNLPRQLSQEDIDSAVLNTLETQVLPSPAARAARVVGPSVVRVQAFGPEEVDPSKVPESDKGRARPPKDAGREARKDGQKPAKEEPKEEPKEVQKGVGTGVVIKDSGLILTNLHVVSGAQRISVVFADGTESEVSITGARPEHDLAVLQAVTLPDDLQPATLRSTGDLREGDGVVAMGFPFDIGPSVSAGVISGFGREYRSTSGERILTNLIQFDAAANPGSSGGPLVTMDGEVVGIVTAILNPNNQRSFVGIGFAVPIENAAAAVGIPPH